MPECTSLPLIVPSAQNNWSATSGLTIAEADKAFLRMLAALAIIRQALQLSSRR